LEISDLAVSYGPIPAVRGISLRVEPGQVVALVGPNGAGKSTTLSAVSGMLRPTAGTITFEGVSLVGRRPEDVARRGVALVPEGRRIFGSLTVGDNLRVAMDIRPKDRRAAAVENVLERFPVLTRLYRTPAGRLSGGEQQQLAIARALVSAPRLLMLDEPSLGLAPQVVDLLFEVVEGLRSEGVTVLIVEQHAARAIACADRSYVMSNGGIVLSGTRDELLQQVDLASEYLGVSQLAVGG
jgi:branched-chain amino acid transport system ATP-binding protein